MENLDPKTNILLVGFNILLVLFVTGNLSITAITSKLIAISTVVTPKMELSTTIETILS